MDVLFVRPEGEGQGRPASHFVRTDELDVLYFRPKRGEHGCPASHNPAGKRIDDIVIRPISPPLAGGDQGEGVCN